jgi:hypothetical protein
MEIPVNSLSVLRGSWVVIGILTLLIPKSATADLILNGCSTATILEGQIGVTDCNVQNLSDFEAAEVEGEFGFVEPFGPDRSDRPISVQPIGELPVLINPGAIHDFQFLFTTDHPEAEVPPDFGLNVFSVIFRAEDVLARGFIPGEYSGGLVYVLDDNTVQVPPTTVTPPPMRINNTGDYDNTVNSAVSRGLITTIPEPGTSGQVLASLLILSIVVWNRRRGRGTGRGSR